MYKNSQLLKNLKLMILEFELDPLTKSFVQRVQKMLRQVKKLCYCDKERTGTHIFHGSFTNVLSG